LPESKAEFGLDLSTFVRIWHGYLGMRKNNSNKIKEHNYMKSLY